MAAASPAPSASPRRSRSSGARAELERLRTLMPRAEGEGRRIVLLGGEPARARAGSCASSPRRPPADGALVLYGACDAVVRTPYGPFVEALDQLARTADPDELRAALGTGGGELTRLLPDLAGARRRAAAAGHRRPGHRAPPAAHGRHRAPRRRHPPAAGAARARGLPLGGRADAAAAAPSDARGRARARARCSRPSATPRPTSPRRLAETLADLRRSDDVVRLHLDGLSSAEVAEFVRRAAGRRRGTSWRDSIYDLTRGQRVPRLRAVARP